MIARHLSFAVALVVLTSLPVRAEPPKTDALKTDAPKTAVFDFELIDTSLEGEMRGRQADETARLLLISNQVRKGLTESGKFDVLDIAPVNAAAHASNLQACGGCDVDLARKLGADLAVTGTISKVSTLILNMHIYIHDVATGRSIASMNADFRGNTDESWSRTASFLLRNRLLAPDYGVPQ
jgi:hypothetical protein